MDAITARPDWVLITSFNEWHEGTDIEPSQEYGRSFLDLTAAYSGFFHGAGGLIRDEVPRVHVAAADGRLVAVRAAGAQAVAVESLGGPEGGIELSLPWKAPYAAVRIDGANAVGVRLEPGPLLPADRYARYLVGTPAGVAAALQATHPDLAAALRRGDQAAVTPGYPQIYPGQDLRFSVWTARPGPLTVAPPFTLSAGSGTSVRVPADARPGTVAVLRGSAGGAPFAIALPVVQPFQLVTTSIPAVAQAGESLPVSLTADTPFRGDGLRLTASVGAGTSPVSAVLDRAQSLLLHFPVPADAAGQVTVSATAEAAGQSQTFGRTVTVLPPEAFPAGLGPVGALVRFGSADTDLGLEREDVGDGLTEPCTLGGQACRQVKGNAGASYLYLRADRGFLHDTDRDVRLAIQYWDAAAGAFSVQYDSALPIGPFAGSYRPGPEVTMDGAGGWKVATVTLPDARFSGRQNGGADFRLAVQRGTLAVAAVYVLAQ